MSLPVTDAKLAHQMFKEIGDVIEEHLGFCPSQFVIILTDGKTAQTLFAGDDPNDMTRLLLEGADNHKKHRGIAQ